MSNRNSSINKTRSFDLTPYLFPTIGDSPVCGKLRSISAHKFLFACANSWVKQSPFYAVIIEMLPEDDPIVVLLEAPFVTRNLAEEKINVYIPKANK